MYWLTTVRGAPPFFDRSNSANKHEKTTRTELEVVPMGAYNMAVVPRLHGCTGCGDEGPMTLQFHFGHTFQDTYRIGERLRWGGNDKGTPGRERAEVIGYQEPCAVCGLDEDREYVLVFASDVLTGEYRYALPEDLTRLEQ